VRSRELLENSLVRSMGCGERRTTLRLRSIFSLLYDPQSIPKLHTTLEIAQESLKNPHNQATRLPTPLTFSLDLFLPSQVSAVVPRFQTAK